MRKLVLSCHLRPQHTCEPSHQVPIWASMLELERKLCPTAAAEGLASCHENMAGRSAGWVKAQMGALRLLDPKTKVVVSAETHSVCTSHQCAQGATNTLVSDRAVTITKQVAAMVGTV